jgi:hypothetical protein
MAGFDINYMAKVSSSGNSQGLNVWTYNGSATGTNEAIATIAASGYFNDFMQNLTLGLGPLNVNDVILIHGNDASAMYTVTTNTTNVTVSVFASSGTVGTANITNLAVTTAKIADGAVTSAKLAATTLQYAAVPISAAEFNGMYAAPKALVAAAGANTLIVLDKIDLLMTYNSAAYAAGGVVAAQYDSTANGAGVIASTTLAAASFQAAVSTGFMFNTGVVPQTFTTCVNKGLYLSNITGAFTTGNSTFIAHVWYKVIPTV